MKRFLPVLAVILFLAACNQVESFEGHVLRLEQEMLWVECTDGIKPAPAEGMGRLSHVKLTKDAVIVNKTEKRVGLEGLAEGQAVRVILEDPERIWENGEREVTAEKIVVLEAE